MTHSIGFKTLDFSPRIKESEFIQFSDVENHDDFYYHEDHRIHVRDQVGYWIVYDCALEDMKTLENDLLLLATHFIQKDKNMRSASNFKRKPANAEVCSYVPFVFPFFTMTSSYYSTCIQFGHWVQGLLKDTVTYPCIEVKLLVKRKLCHV
ncbi:unnamed protein product [Dibothriocephalus latus]|uniref:Uncharacterized protein n=1 Tax=Dibothriocephalus latus TaxID=60516 RepID=A0A3P6QEF8_DIBLA|nr:unnamed protein product [Dibothriocephalus latus]